MARRRRVLVLPRALSDLAKTTTYFQGKFEQAHRVFVHWADLESKGALKKKERSLDAEFLHGMFGDALGYKTSTDAPDCYQLEREHTVAGVGRADGALGNFTANGAMNPIAVIELKGADTDLDRDKFNGRTPVQQCWDYLNALPDCPWGIVSNFVSLRLYHRDMTPLAYEEFALQELRLEKRAREFYCLFERGGLLPSGSGVIPRALRLLRLTGERQREVGDELYQSYRRNRLYLIDHLHHKCGKSVETAIRIAQKLLDRIIFIAFCEDRGLLPAKIIDKTYGQLAPFAKATNPRWQNFLGLFHGVDRGHKTLELDVGYNGGLFKHDADVDELQLDDEWTGFFREVGRYDFRDEVNVDVLGHLFEKSVTELEKLRFGGLFDSTNGGVEIVSRMPKSALRKRFGIYYTPVELTDLIVRSTVGATIDERLDAVAKKHALDPDNANGESDEKLRGYWNDCLGALKRIRVCDPACGSGAFLIQAYHLFEERYGQIADELRACGFARADRIADEIPDLILGHNLFGVDLSAEAVEITQLALWIRSAQHGRTLSDLTANIVCGNSLIDDSEIDSRALNWRETFAGVFDGDDGGFDCVVGNPPWERLKLQEREFFSFSAPDVAGAVNAAKRRKLIAAMETDDPKLFARYTAAKARAEQILDFTRKSGRFPLTGKGDINTYALFAELAHSIVAPSGRVGLLVPSGIASDMTTKDFFNELTGSQSLISLYDFENRKRLFPEVDGRFKFCALSFGGKRRRCASAAFVFFAHTVDDLDDRWRQITLSAGDIALLNPNTRTCPIFRARRDAALTKCIYGRVPILWDRNRKAGGNPWEIRFKTMFHQTNDAELFLNAAELTEMGAKLSGNRWTRGKTVYPPVYEAKMIQAYDHRAAGVVIEVDNWVRQGQTKATTQVGHQNPEFAVQPRWWVDEAEIEKAVGCEGRSGYLAYKDVTSPTNERTMIAALIPHVGVVNSAPLVLTGDAISLRRTCCLLANLNSFVLDFAARQKVGNVHLNFFIVEQLPVLPPDDYAQPCPWNPKQKLERWISDRVLKLTCTANDMLPLAEAAGFKPGVHKWRVDERAKLRAELDAAYFHLYGVGPGDAEYILSTFAGTQRRDRAETDTFRTAELILAAMDELKPA